MTRVFTMGSDESKMCLLKATALDAGLDITYVVNDYWNGFVDKIITIRNAICDLPDDEVVCVVDAYDVLAFSNTAEIMRKFKTYDCDILFSGELTCFPDRYLANYRDIYAASGSTAGDGSNFKYVNSGGYIGYKKHLMAFFDWKPIEAIREICEDGGDQTYFTEFFVQNPGLAKIDTHQHLFQSMYKTEFGDFELMGGRIHNKILDTYPCFVHFNGFVQYGMRIVNLTTGNKENAMSVIRNTARESLAASSPIQLHYAVPFFITIDGVIQPNLPQIGGAN